jgi:DNA recombination protein RmuC
MQNEIILISVVIFVTFCLGYWLLVRPVSQLQTTTREMQTLLIATQTALAQSQQETAALRRALTATTIQGQWGEMQLQRIVELAGMLPYCDFEPQVTLSGVNGVQRPDLLVKLSNGRTIVVDVKAPVDTYIQAHESLDDATRALHLRQYAGRVRDHMTRLAKKEYWKNFEPSPAWVVLLIPNEGMFRAALEYDPTLLDSGTQQHVLLASPITLLALLKAMAYGWQQENRARSVQQIIEHSHTLQQKLLAFLMQWRKLHKELSDTTTAFNQCIATYQTAILPVIQKICDLDGTIDADQYDLSRTPPLRVPKPIEDLPVLTKEEVEANVITLPHMLEDDNNRER